MEPTQIQFRETSVPLKGSFLYSEEFSAYREEATALGKQFCATICSQITYHRKVQVFCALYPGQLVKVAYSSEDLNAFIFRVMQSCD